MSLDSPIRRPQENLLASELCLCTLAQPPIEPPQISLDQEERNRVVLRMRSLFGTLNGGASEAEQQALNALAVCLMGGGQADLTRLNEWCAGFQNNPRELANLFNKFRELLQRFGISSQVVYVPEVEQVDPEHVYMDIAVPGTNHALRLSSSPNHGGFVVTTSTIIDANGAEQEVQLSLPGNSPLGAMRAIQRAMVRSQLQLHR